MPQRISEAVKTSATPVADKPGRFLIKLIDAGWGSSGYYSAEVLKAAGESSVFPTGLHMYLDHPTRTEEYDRPERSVRDLAAVLSEDARYDEGLKALVAEASVFPLYRPVLDDMKDSIGVSIRAYAESEPGEAEGERGQVITELVEGISTDFVTHAGRGGKILEVIESARPKVGEAHRKAVAETTANDTRALLDAELVDAYGDEDVWVYVIDFDDETVWFCQNSPDSRATYAQGYTLSGATVTLDGSPTEVRPVTTYVPVGESGDPLKQEDGTMPQIEEQELSRLRESDRRVQEAEAKATAAETRATTAESERDEARDKVARHERTSTVSRIMRESLADDAHKGIELDDYQRRGILGEAVIKDGVVDESATRTAFDKALDKIGESAAPARVRGMGAPVATESNGNGSAIPDDLDPLEAMDQLAAESFDDFGGDLLVKEG